MPPKALTAAAIFLLHAALSPSPMTAADPTASSADSLPTSPVWTIDDIVRTETVDGVTLSRDGETAAWVRSTVETVEGKEKRIGNLWLARFADGAEGARTARVVQLTRGHDRMDGPAFSPDGAHLAFLTERSIPGAASSNGSGSDEGDVAGNQVWVIPTGGGEAFPVTRFDRPVRSFGWIDDQTLVVLAPESKSAWELEHAKRHDKAQVVEDAEHEVPVRLFRVPIRGGSVRRITTNEDWIDGLAVSPDGTRAVVTAQQSLSWEFDSRTPPHTRLVDLETGSSERLFAEEIRYRGAPRRLLPHSIRWQPDSSGFYFVDEYSTHPRYRSATVSQLFHHDVASGRTTRVELDWEPGLGRGYAVVPGGVVALLADGVHERLVRIERSGDGTGWTTSEIEQARADEGAGAEGEHTRTMDSIAAAPNGTRIVYQQSSATEPHQLYAATLDGDGLGAPGRVTDLNGAFASKPTGRVDVVRFTGARGDEVEALLHYPLGWSEGDGPAPLILDIHGGPASRDRQAWDQRWPAPSLLWRQRGAFVLQVNYHGSTGYGLEWVESIGGGNYYELEIPDLEAGVDWAIGRGLADPDRLASVGWSNGGILTAELITRTDRYRAASVGAADVEWISDWANVDFGASFDNYYFGGPPWEDPDLYIEKSPFFRLTEVTTPTIIYTGTEDTNVPPHQSRSLFRALQQLGKTETRLVLFPGEPHGLRKIVDQRRKIREDLDWLDRYLFASAPTDGTGDLDAVRPGTRLAAMMARAEAARAGSGTFGREEAGTLVPETVSFAGFEVGRFEVTRAQWAAFDPSYEIAPGTEDLPVTGVGFEQADQYAAWLAERTGRPFRLPTVAEAEKLSGAAGDGGNTLDHWAGYTPNPGDAGAIRTALSDKIAARAPLLLPVGSVPGAKTGEEGATVFDLDGNAAEWARADDGLGKAIGPSAERSTDPRGDGGDPAPEYIGLRVLVGD